MADKQTLDAIQPAATTEASQKPFDPASRNSGEAELDWPWGSDSYDEGAPSSGGMHVKTWRSRLRRALHMSSGITKGYSDDLRFNPEIVSLNHRQVGYPKVAGFQDCDPSLQIFRKFGWLHFRSLLSLQDELAELEKTMRSLDQWEYADGDYKNLLSRRRHDQQPETARQEVAAKIKNKLAEYDELLLRSQKVQAMKRPSSRAQLNLFNLIRSTESLVADESEFIRYSPDLAALVPGDEHGWFRTFLGEALGFFSPRLAKVTLSVSCAFLAVYSSSHLLSPPSGRSSTSTNLSNTSYRDMAGLIDFLQAAFRSKEQAWQTGDEELLLFDHRRMEIVSRINLTVLMSSLLLVPVLLLLELQPSKPSGVRRQRTYQILTIFLFTLVFAASVTIFTRAKRHEVLQATAAYSAFLVVFLGNRSNAVSATNDLLNQTPT